MKLSDEKIAQIRRVRLSGKNQTETANECGVSQTAVSKYCKDLNIEKVKTPNVKKLNFYIQLERQKPCTVYDYTKLSLEDQIKYNNCKPSDKNEDTKTFITGKKSDYGRAAVFEDYRVSHGICMGGKT